MLTVTLATHKKTFQTMGKDFMLGTIRRYPGIHIMTDRPGEMMFQYPNELQPFIFAAMFIGDSQGISAVAGPPYDGFSVTIGLQAGAAFLVSQGGRNRPATARGVFLAKRFMAQGATLMP